MYLCSKNKGANHLRDSAFVSHLQTVLLMTRLYYLYTAKPRFNIVMTVVTNQIRIAKIETKVTTFQQD